MLRGSRSRTSPFAQSEFQELRSCEKDLHSQVRRSELPIVFLAHSGGPFFTANNLNHGVGKIPFKPLKWWEWSAIPNIHCA